MRTHFFTKGILLIAGLLLFPCLLFGQVADDITQLGSSAKMIGIGNVEGFDDSASAIFENPAALSSTKKYSLSAFQATLMEDTNYINLAGAAKTPIGEFGVGFMQVAVGGIDRVAKNDSGDKISVGYDQSKDMVVKLAYSPQTEQWIPDLKTGISFNYFNRDLVGATGKGASLGLGLKYASKDSPFSVSFQIKNALVLQSMTYSTGNMEVLQTQVVLGGAYAQKELTYYAQAKISPSQFPVLKSFGITYQPENTVTTVSLGMAEIAGADNVAHTQFSVGLGLNLQNISMNFAFNKSDYIAQDNRYYLSINVYE